MAHQVQRKVEGADCRYDAAGDAQREPHLTSPAWGGVERDAFAVQALGLLAGETYGLHRTIHLGATLGYRLALFQRDRATQFLASFAQNFGSLVEYFESLIRGALAISLAPRFALATADPTSSMLAEGQYPDGVV